VKILFSVQRYGDSVAGGSEAACRQLAEQLAARGHAIEVVTSCAKSYVDWADHFAPGSSELNGVVVHRFPVQAPRIPELFGPLHGRVLDNPRAPLFVQRDWLRVQGPHLRGFTAWLHENARRFDVANFFTYLYPTTGMGLPVAAAYCPTILHPTAHDEPMMALRVFDRVVRAADGLVCLTEEELALIRRRFRYEPLAEVIGIGLDVHPVARGARFREQFGLGESPYIIVVGRIDSGKGSDEAWRYFVEYQRRFGSKLKLVVLGEPVMTLASHPDVIATGFVDEQTKLDAIVGATALVQPSYFESFSLALCEGWICRRPALVQGRCEVLNGQSARSSGGIPYRSFAEFVAGLNRLLADPGLAGQMGEAGRRYVLDNYQWDSVLDRYERFAARVVKTRRSKDHLTRDGGPGGRSR
jgi:glycosyltransferase involved in cell wall biosynthesis